MRTAADYKKKIGLHPSPPPPFAPHPHPSFMRMAADYKKKIGFKATLLLEPKPQEPTKHQ
jgi:hypothetical protein